MAEGKRIVLDGMSHNDLRLKIKNFETKDIYFTSNGKLLDPDSLTEDKEKEKLLIKCHLRVLGGKGGFGSMLRAIGAQIEKTTNREACRDLSGRRMRDVNNEKTINEWLEKQKAEEEDRAKKKKEKLERILNPPRHILSDSKYVTELKSNADKVEDALKQGLEKMSGSTKGTSISHGKRQHVKDKGGKAKKQRMWLGLNDSDLEDEDDEERPSSDNECLACPVEEGKKAELHTAILKEQLESEGKTSYFDKQPQEEETFVKTGDESKSQLSDRNETPLAEKQQACTKSGSSKHDDKTAKAEFQKVGDTKEGNDTPIDLQSFSSAEELEVLGLERLKCELKSHGLKCGGTLPQRAQRLFLLRATPIEKLDKSLFAKASTKNSK